MRSASRTSTGCLRVTTSLSTVFRAIIDAHVTASTLTTDAQKAGESAPAYKRVSGQHSVQKSVGQDGPLIASGRGSGGCVWPDASAAQPDTVELRVPPSREGIADKEGEGEEAPHSLVYATSSTCQSKLL